MTAGTNLSVIAGLVLARMLAAKEKGETGTRIKKDLEPLLAHYGSGRVLEEQVEQVLVELESGGRVVVVRGKRKNAAPKVTLTARGRREALEFLGVAELGPKTTWALIQKDYLPACALGLAVSRDVSLKVLTSDSGFRAILLLRAYRLPGEGVSKLEPVLDMLAWKLMGFEGEVGKFNVKSVKTALLNRELGDGRALDLKKAANRLLARQFGARSDDPRALRAAVVCAWIQRENAASGTPSPAGPSAAVVHRASSPAPSVPGVSLVPAWIDLRTFAERVKAAAHACLTGRFGEHKVFIAHVWRSLQTDPTFAKMDLAAFKEYLVQANNARVLDLSRADLVQAMDADDVRQSEVRYLNATFHFIRT